MSYLGEQVLLRVYLESADRAPHAPTFDRLVKSARAQHLAGATVLRGIMGFSAKGLLKHEPWSIVDHLPVIVEIVDSSEKIAKFVHDTLDTTVVHGLATLERANVMMVRHRGHDQPNKLQLGT